MDSVDVTTFPETEGVPTRRLTGNGNPGTAAEIASPTQMAPGSDERCAECGAPMASDQRYCVECGERRGERRFPVTLESSAATSSSAATPPRESRRSRMSPSATLIAGVGTLLLAMGVGVLIGRSGNSSSGHGGSGVQVVTVGSAAGTTAPGSTGTAGTAAAAAAAAAKSSNAKAASGGKSAIKPPPKSSLPPPTVKVGSKGSGKGYKNGKFTGEFFGSEE